jgi:hypothetical protein
MTLCGQQAASVIVHAFFVNAVLAQLYLLLLD